MATRDESIAEGRCILEQAENPEVLVALLKCWQAGGCLVVDPEWIATIWKDDEVWAQGSGDKRGDAVRDLAKHPKVLEALRNG